MTEVEVLRVAYQRTIENVDGMRPGDLDRPTPCADWDVRALLSHIVAATDGLVAMLHDEQPDWSKDALGDDPAGAVRRALSQSVAAWSEPGAVDKPSQQMPGMRVVDFAMGDAVAHSWDLAAALGRPLDLDDDVVRVVHDRWAGEPAEIGRTFGAFGPRVDMPPDAPVLERFVALLGRDPHFGSAS